MMGPSGLGRLGHGSGTGAAVTMVPVDVVVGGADQTELRGPCTRSPSSSTDSTLTLEELEWDTLCLWVSVSPCVSGEFLPYPQHRAVVKIKRFLEKM